MIDKKDVFANIFNKINFIFTLFGLLLGIFVYLDFFFFHNLRNYLPVSMVTGMGILFLFIGIGTYMNYFYLFLRWIKRRLHCRIPEFFTVTYLEIEGNGLFEKYYPIMENVIGREVVSSYYYPKDSFSVGENIEVLWNDDKTEYVVNKFNYTTQFIGFSCSALLLCVLGFSFVYNQHWYLFFLFLIMLSLILILCDTIQNIIDSKYNC